MSPIGIGRVDSDGQVIYGNPKWMEMSHGDQLLELVHPDDREKLQLNPATFEVRWGTSGQFVCNGRISARPP